MSTYGQFRYCFACVYFKHVSFILITMNKSNKIARYGNSDRETQVRQRLAPTYPLEGSVKENWHAKKRSGKKLDLCRERKMNPQSGEDLLLNMTNKIRELIKFARIDFADEVVSQVEGIAALAITLQGCNDYPSMAGAIFLYFRKFSDVSITSHVTDYLSTILMEPQAGSEDKKEQSDWISMLKSARDNWGVVKNNRLFSHLSKLLGLVVTLEMCKATDVTFSVGRFKVFEPDLKLLHGNAIDIFDAALNTVVFFVETISLCWQQGSLRPLLVNDKEAAELDDEYARVVLWWDLVKNGNLKRVADVSDQEFDAKLEAISARIKNVMTNASSFDKKLYNDKYMKLLGIKNDYITMKISCGVRRAPYCVELFGASSQGKTTFGEQIVQALLTSAGLSTDKEYQAAYNPADRYMSNWTTNKLVLLVDDMANDKSEFVERSPTRVIIDVANNAPCYANMADLGSKGKVFVEPEICLVTTNVKDLDARVYSNCPYSIQRRMHAVITVEAKTEFQYMVDGKPQGIDPKKIQEYNRTNPKAAFDDIWLLTVEKAVAPPPQSLGLAAKYAPVKYNGKVMSKVPFRDVVQYLIEDFHNHRAAQDNILERMRERKEVCKCGIDGCVQIRGWCDKHKDHVPEPVVADKKEAVVEKESFFQRWFKPFSLGSLWKKKEEEKSGPQFGQLLTKSLEKFSDTVYSRMRRDIFGVASIVECAGSVSLYTAAKMFDKHWDWMRLVPTPWLDDERFFRLAMMVSGNNLRNKYIRYTGYIWSTICGSLYYGAKHYKFPVIRTNPGYPNIHVVPCLALGIGIVWQKGLVSVVKTQFRQELLTRNTIAPGLKDARDKHVANICKACGVVGAMYALARIYRCWKTYDSQGSLEPKTMRDIEERDAEDNPWTGVSPRVLPVDPSTTTTTPEQLKGLVLKNLVYGTVVAGEKTYMVNGLYLTSNVVVIPTHYFLHGSQLDVTFRKKDPQTSGGKFVVRLSENLSVPLPDTDLSICYSCAGGSFKNIIKYLPTGKLSLVEFELLWRNTDGDVIEGKGLAREGAASNKVADFEGLIYQSMTMSTFPGLCGAVLHSPRKALIMGMHVGGLEGTPKGCASILRQDDVKCAIRKLKEMEGVLVTGSAEKFEPQILGKRVLGGARLHKKSPLNYMPKNSQVEYYGECPGMTTFKTDVKVTKISEAVTDITGVPNIYRGPVEDPQWFGWQSCLSNLANPAIPFEPDLLDIAIRDYKADLLPIFSSNLWRDCEPLDDKTNLCGAPGKKFIDAIPLNTSIGFPLSGSKRNFVVELEPTKDYPSNREFIPEIKAEIERCLECYKRGERAYAIAKACKKDEVLTKPKCRIFYGNPIALTFLIRRYFLPILRVLQFNPLKSECAVGINSHGREWDELHRHILKHGSDRVLAGDYGKYDQKLPSQLVGAAIRILIDFARLCKYTDEDITIMEAMAGELMFPVIAFNGDLIGLTEGTHISGNSLTVIINGICGSLNLRCCFYKLYPPKDFDSRLPFRDHVSLTTYGDDNVGSVSQHVPKFNIKSVSQILGEYGQTYTMPDKESELVEYMSGGDFEFLKRKSVFHPLLGVHIGALMDASCFKMLHCYIRNKSSPITEEHACAMNIDTALREWFNSGEELYEVRRNQMKQVAERCGITHLCTQLDVTYHDGVDSWISKYGNKES